MLNVAVISSPTLEEWDFTTAFTKGQGGSETSHVEMVKRLAQRGVNVTSYAPLYDGQKEILSPEGVVWRQSRDFEISSIEGPAIIINYRDPNLFTAPKNPLHRYWFVAQDCDYGWTREQRDKVDRHLSLCKEHTKYTLSHYPDLIWRDYTSSNGIRTDYIEALEAKGVPARVPYRLFWASSPDRGLKLLLENWFRVRERFPLVTLRIAYGFNNMEIISRWTREQGGVASQETLQKELTALMTQPGVEWLGRLNQEQVYLEHFQSSAYPYCSDWPETSMITIMEAMACGNVPVSSNHWAQGEHASAAPWPVRCIDGVPQRSSLIKSIWFEELFRVLKESAAGKYDDSEYNYYESSRKNLMDWAREGYNWELIVDQWLNWIKEDSENPPRRNASGQVFDGPLAYSAGAGRKRS